MPAREEVLAFLIETSWSGEFSSLLPSGQALFVRPEPAHWRKHPAPALRWHLRLKLLQIPVVRFAPIYCGPGHVSFSVSPRSSLWISSVACGEPFLPVRVT